MIFARKVWRILVAIKDGMALVLLLMFFALLYAVLTARPSPGAVRGGALLLDLDGTIVEEPAAVDALQVVLSGSLRLREFRQRDLVRAIEAAARDRRIRAVVLDLDRFLGGGQVHLQRIGEALDRVRAANKPVLAYATAYGDDAMLLAAHASEVWVEPLGGALIAGPGGSQLYYKALLDRLKVKAHVFKVGTYKSAIEPFTRTDQSPEAEEAMAAVYAALWDSYLGDIGRARPGARLEAVVRDPVAWQRAAGGDTAQAARSAGLVDRIGDKVAFGRRVAALVGKEPGGRPGTFLHTGFDPWLADIGEKTAGKPVGVITVAGEIVDGDAGPGQAGGDRIARLLDDALDDGLAALVVRVDSPGGSVLAAERIRAAIERHKARNIPIVVSMANLAASGGYWVSTPATAIFAEPATITGSIGIFGVIPTFEAALADWGVNADGIRTTPLSGQPDLLGGLTPQVEAMIQGQIEFGYRRFVGLVARARAKSPEEADRVAQGRVWDGGTARQIGLVDRHGDLDDALAFAAARAGLKPGAWHPVFLGQEQNLYQSVLAQMLFGGDDDSGSGDARSGSGVFGLVAARQAALTTRLTHDLALLLGSRGMLAYCLECPVALTAPPPASASFLARVTDLAALGR